MQPFGSAPVRNFVQTPSKLLVCPWSREEPPRQRAIVEAGAADDDRQLAAGVDVADDAFGVARELRRGVDLGGIGDVNHDGRINALDLGAIKGNLNASLAALTAPAAGAAGAVRSTLVPFSNVAIAPMSALDAAKRTGVWDVLQA